VWDSFHSWGSIFPIPSFLGHGLETGKTDVRPAARTRDCRGRLPILGLSTRERGWVVAHNILIGI